MMQAAGVTWLTTQEVGAYLRIDRRDVSAALQSAGVRPVAAHVPGYPNLKALYWRLDQVQRVGVTNPEADWEPAMPAVALRYGPGECPACREPVQLLVAGRQHLRMLDQTGLPHCQNCPGLVRREGLEGWWRRLEE